MIRTRQFLQRRCTSYARRASLNASILQDVETRSNMSPRRLHFRSPQASFSTESPSSRLPSSHAQNDPYEKAVAELPEGAQLHLDFFGEPVTFFGVSAKDDISNVVASLDVFEIGVATKGKAFTGGGEEDGIPIQAAHSAAQAWSELLRHASVMNEHSPEKSAPMLAYVATAPVLAQTGVGYLKYIDSLLNQVESGVDGLRPIQMFELAKNAAAMKDHEYLNPREKAHLLALDCMLRHDHKRALIVLLRHLEVCPGDGLALSMAMDLAHTVGDPDAALRAAGSVSSYWNERRGGIIRPSIPGYNTAASLVAVGLAVGGRRSEAEQLAVFSMEKSEKLAGGIATWALAHIFDGEGRTAEGISACANSDGSRNFEACGLLFFNTILSGYGVRFALDREERGRGRSAALRLYDNNYQLMLEQTGFSMGVPPDKVVNQAPMGWRASSFQKKNEKKKESFISNLLGKPLDDNTVEEVEDGEVVVRQKTLPELRRENWTPSCEDVLTWMPPTPQVLSDATLLLLRLTLNGTISSKNFRWENLRNAWSALLTVQKRHAGDLRTFEFYPLVCVASSLLASPKQVGNLSGAGSRLATALHKMGELLDLGAIAANADDDENDEPDEDGGFLSTVLFKDVVADKEPDFWLPVQEEARKEEWRTVLKLLSSAIDGVYDPTGEGSSDVMLAELGLPFQSWEFDVRPVLEHATVYAACKCGDTETLSLARSICSRGVTLRQNSPEEWWRYSIVLGLLGDQVASEDALANSLAFGGGQGARKDDLT